MTEEATARIGLRAIACGGVGCLVFLALCVAVGLLIRGCLQ